MFNLMRIAVLGHANAGKTAMLRTLARSQSFGSVSALPGTTEKAATLHIEIDGAARLRLIDTPGLGDPAGLIGYLRELDAPASLAARITAFLRGPEAKRSFQPEAQALAAAVGADAILYVVDTRESPLPKFQYEIEMLTALGKPVLPVRNFAGHPRSRAGEWDAVFAGNNLLNAVSFDALAPEAGAETGLYEGLAASAVEWRAYLADFVKALGAEAQRRRGRACLCIARLLVRAAAARATLSKEDFALSDKREAFVRAFRQRVVGFERECIDALLAVYRFRSDDADIGTLAVGDRWEADLFNPETLRQAGKHLTGGAAVGAGVGMAADLALAGLSLGAGAAIGAAIGGAASQGMTQFGRKVYHKLRGIQEISVGDDVLAVMAFQMLGLARALEHRAHAATGKISLVSLATDPASASCRQAVDAAQPARNYPDWADAGGQDADPDSRRGRTEAAVRDALAALMARDGDDGAVVAVAAPPHPG